MATEQEVRSLLVPLANSRLLLPSAVVAEVAGFTPPSSREDAPEHVLGTIPWRQRALPVVCMETLVENQQPDNFGPRARIIVLYGLDSAERLPFYGIMAHGIPRAYMAGRSNITAEPLAEEDPAFLPVSLDNEGDAFLPNLDSLQASLVEWLEIQDSVALD